MLYQKLPNILKTIVIYYWYGYKSKFSLIFIYIQSNPKIVVVIFLVSTIFYFYIKFEDILYCIIRDYGNIINSGLKKLLLYSCILSYLNLYILKKVQSFLYKLACFSWDFSWIFII